MNFLKTMKNLWRWWAKALGEKAHRRDNVADNVAIIRTVIFFTYLTTNCFIIAGVVRHWNDKQKINIESYENPKNQQNLHTKRWNDLGVDRNS